MSAPEPDTIVLVTGGAAGIGRALAERWGAAGHRVAIADLHGAADTAAALPGGPHLGLELDVRDEQAVAAVVSTVEDTLGPVGTAFSNAGVNRGHDLGEPDDWALALDVHVRAHVTLARHLVPVMLARGGGRFVITASAAGLLANVESAPYTVSKHAAVALAEWLAVRHGDDGLQVACVCPQGVRTAMTAGREGAATGSNRFLNADEVAAATDTALARGEFLVLPHPEVAEYERRKVADRDRWLAGMRRARRRLLAPATAPTAEENP